MTASNRQRPLQTAITDYFWEGPPTKQIVVGCGSCGTRREFTAQGVYAAMSDAREVGWQVEFRPVVRGGEAVPFIRCPDHRESAR